jgi:hypothetical protein
MGGREIYLPFFLFILNVYDYGKVKKQKRQI